LLYVIVLVEQYYHVTQANAPPENEGIPEVSGAKRVIVAMTHTVKGKPKIVQQCSLPLTAARPVSLIVTEMAVIEPTADGLLLKELAPGITVTAVRQATQADLIIPDHVPEMPIL
jgi:acetate CoA/acetoacetate CoA-transferase beta subunit